MRVIQDRERLGFPLEPRQALGVRGKRVWQTLDRDLAVERRVGGPPDLPHAAFTERRGDFVNAETSAEGEGQAAGSIRAEPNSR